MRVIYDRPRDEPASLFAAPWMDAAEAWAASEGRKIVQWRLDRCFRAPVVVPGTTADLPASLVDLRWHQITWNDYTQQWEVKLCS